MFTCELIEGLYVQSLQATGTFEAIAEYQNAGGSFAVCTGRDLGSARGVLKGLDIDRMPGKH